MTEIFNAFKNKKALVIYMMAGDPSLDVTAELMREAAASGADMIEIGIPFSDPIAEGPVIQAASERALSCGTTLHGILAMIDKVSGSLGIPVCIMSYVNPLFMYGYEKFFSCCQSIGVGGVIIPDLPYEEHDELKTYAHAHGVANISLIAPTSRERIRRIARDAEGFIYLVSSLGTTGMRDGTADISGIAASVREVSEVPLAVGFGISTPEQAHRYAGQADGVIIGSAVVDIICRHGVNSVEHVGRFIRRIKDAM